MKIHKAVGPKVRAFWLIIPLVLFGVGCRTIRQPQANLSPPETKPIYQIDVSDSDEAALLRQQLGLVPIRQDGNTLFFTGSETNLNSLRQLGYLAQPVDTGAVFYRVVQVPKKGAEERLKRSGIIILLREKGYWVVRGNLTQLSLLRAQGYHVLQLQREPRPREVEIIVNRREDVQQVAELHVDIYSVSEAVRVKQIRIKGGAFDDQIDKLRANGFTVTVKPN